MRAIGSALTTALIAALTVSTVAAAPSSVRARADWTAKLVGKDGRKVSGAASAVATADGTGTQISVTLEGDTPGAIRPWHVHSGSCAASGGVVGGGRAYTPMSVDGTGRAQAKASIALVLPDTGKFYVNIHDAAAAMSIIVACGDLQKR